MLVARSWILDDLAVGGVPQGLPHTREADNLAVPPVHEDSASASPNLVSRPWSVPGEQLVLSDGRLETLGLSPVKGSAASGKQIQLPEGRPSEQKVSNLPWVPPHFLWEGTRRCRTQMSRLTTTKAMRKFFS